MVKKSEVKNWGENVRGENVLQPKKDPIIAEVQCTHVDSFSMMF